MKDLRKQEAESTPVSVIILNYNGLTNLGPDLLSRCLSSVLHTDYPKFQVIFFDNGSKDGSVEFVKKVFGRNSSLRVVASPRNYGFALGNNYALDYADGEYIALLNNDVEVETNWLRELARVLDVDSKVGVAQSKILCLDRLHIQTMGDLFDPSLSVYLVGENEEDNGQYDRNCEITFACGAALITRKSVVEKIGLFDPDYFWYHDDSDLSWRARLAGYKVLAVPRSIVYHKGMGTSNRTFKRKEETFYYLTSRVGLFVKNFGLKSMLRFGKVLLTSVAMDSLGLLLQGEGKTLVKFVAWIPKNFKSNWKNRLIVQRQIRKVEDAEIVKSFLDNSIFVLRIRRQFDILSGSQQHANFNRALHQITRDYYFNHLYKS